MSDRARDVLRMIAIGESLCDEPALRDAVVRLERAANLVDEAWRALPVSGLGHYAPVMDALAVASTAVHRAKQAAVCDLMTAMIA